MKEIEKLSVVEDFLVDVYKVKGLTKPFKRLKTVSTVFRRAISMLKVA